MSEYETEYRLYSFVNMYLSDIQRGIQTAHLVHNLFIDWIFADHHDAAWQSLVRWGQRDKTIIVLNGGYSSELVNIYNDIEVYGDALQLPYSFMRESADALNGALTCVGLVVPSDIYDAENRGVGEEISLGADYIVHPFTNMPLTGDMLQLYNLIKGYPLA